MPTFYMAIWKRWVRKNKQSFSYVRGTRVRIKSTAYTKPYTKHYAITSTLVKLGGTNWLQIPNCEYAFVGELCSSSFVGELEHTI